MAETILLVFEGARTEPKILDSFRQHYLKQTNSTVFHICYEAEVYQLWKSINDDPDLSLIRELQAREKKLGKPSGIPYEQVNDIFLFFDYDGQASTASDTEMEKMLGYFNDSNSFSGQGLLYISYPMVEAIRHLEKGVDFKDVVVSAKIKGAEYKQQSACSNYQHLNKLQKSDWHYINSEHYKKANFIVRGQWIFPANKNDLVQLNQARIFDSQLKKYIQPRQEIAVLSAFPFFIIEYFGEKALAELEPTPNPA
jgi:hypothetical protein